MRRTKPSATAVLALAVLALGIALAGGQASGHPRPRDPMATPVRFSMARDFTLSFDHRLGEAEARRRVEARLVRLQRELADKIGSSAITWSGDEAQVQVFALGQSAAGRVAVSDTHVLIHVHLPLLLAPLSGNVQAFLTKIATETLRP